MPTLQQMAHLGVNGFGLLLCWVSAAGAGDFVGWQGMRVVNQDGNPAQMLAIDLDGQGRDELIVVNTRHSRLDIFRWLKPDERTTEPTPVIDPDNLNELPLAPDWKKSELALDELPLDVVAQDLDGDQKPELVILTSPSNKVLAYHTDGADKWRKTASWDLLAGTPTGKRHVLARTLADGRCELLLSYEQGIQSLTLTPGSRPAWLSPREGHGRHDWRLADLDGDGDLDLVEWGQQARQTVRWYECFESKLLPAQALFDQTVQGFEVLAAPQKPAELLLLGGAQQGVLRRYVMTRGEEKDLGRQESVPISGGAGATWCGLSIGQQPALVAVDPTQPRLRVQPLGGEGWLAEQSFPTIGNIRGMVAPPAQPGTLLIWTKDASDLHESRWDSGRLTYPRPLTQSADVKDRRILALDRVGQRTWWVQRVGSDLDLYVWQPGQAEAGRTRFAGVGPKVETAIWLGGETLLVQDTFTKNAKLVRLVDGMVKISEPAHLSNLSKADLGQFELLEFGGQPRAARLTEGVVQWLDENLQAADQIMLSAGQRMASFVPLADGQAWALEQGGAFVHRLKPDDAGILREAETIRLSGGARLVHDPLLGMMLVDQDRLIRLSRGRSWELKLLDSLDSRVGRPSGVKEATIHRIMTSDLDGDGIDEVILCDDRRHQLTVLARTDEGLKPRLSWPVFEDQTYPYGGRQHAQASEPRLMIGLNADGDGARDAALLCHDRLLFYMGREMK
ncbi:MAG TPA: hypothetical protein VJ783_11010 [Pirellulales bacterium]|nr:hypothetical protein [Pirellulales bacterium]